MKPRFLLIVALLLLVVLPVMAQKDCGDGLPCGKLLWDLPGLPELPSPTPIPTQIINLTPVGQPTSAPVPSAVPIPTNPALATVDTSQIGDSMATLNAAVDSTAEVVYDLNGTPVDTSETFGELAANAGQFFGYARSLPEANMGALTPLVAFLVFTFIVIVAIKAITYLLPILTAVWGFIRKIIEVVLEFIPL